MKKYLHDLFRTFSIKCSMRKNKFCYRMIKKWDIDITDQYSNFKIDTEYLKLNVRALHAFQLDLIFRAIGYTEGKISRILDFGDSAGTHCTYIKRILPHVKTMSIIDDLRAFGKIKNRNLPVLHMTDINDLKKSRSKDDLIMSFQVFEHLQNPIEALKIFKKKSDRLILTVPYLRQSQIGMYHLRNNEVKNVNSENTHIFELCPADWKLLFEYTDWKVEYENIYYQYPRYIPFISFLLKWYWRKFDFEGFYGVILC